MLDQVILDRGFLRQDLLQQFAQLRDIPLPITEFVDELADGVFRRNTEIPVKRTIGAFDAQVGIEHQQRLTHGIDYVLGIGMRDSNQFPGTLDFIGVDGRSGHQYLIGDGVGRAAAGCFIERFLSRIDNG